MSDTESPITIVSDDGIDAAAWDAYVGDHAEASLYHQLAWRGVIEQVFGKQCRYLSAVSADGEIRGLLPLVKIGGWVFPKVLVSLPYCNFGGVITDDSECEKALIAQAVTVADSMGCSRIELRGSKDQSHAGWSVREDKVGMTMALPASTDELGRALGSKLRSQIKRSRREGAVVKIGAAERVADFYRVFAKKMWELGTPVYSQKFFECVASAFPDHATVVVVYIDEKPVASAFLLAWRDTLEIPWAAADSDFNRQAVNMLLYWEVLAYAIDKGFARFDFGRSTRDAGTYRFKQQWGAEPAVLPWLVRSSAPAEESDAGSGRSMELASKAWRHLPLPVASWLGPKFTSNLPW